MLQAFEAVIDERGQIRLAEPIDLPVGRRALVIVLNEPAARTSDTPSASDRYTKKQGQYLAFIHHYTKMHSFPPAEADIQAYFGVTPPTVHQMILRLEEKALIKRVPRKARTIEVRLPPEQLPPLE